MTLPTGIEDAKAAAMSLLNQAQQPPASAPVQSSAPEAPADFTQVQTADQGPALSLVQPSQNVPAQPAQNADFGRELEHLKRQFSVLKGKYDAEVPRLQHENNILKAENEIFRRQTASQQVQQVAPAKTDEISDDEVRRTVKKELVDEYGLDCWREQIRIARLQSESQLKDIRTQVEQSREEIAQSREERFFSDLATLVPDYKVVNDNEKFREWLGTVDPMSGSTYQSFLTDAQRQGDAMRVANILNTWKRSVAATQNPSNRAPSITSQVAPSSAPALPPPTPGQGRRYTFSEWTRLKIESINLEPAKKEALTKELHAAMQQGRVLPDNQSANAAVGFA